MSEHGSKRRCLLIGARGFVGTHIEKLLRESEVDVIGTTRKLAAGDPDSWLQYNFPHDSIHGQIGERHFDFAIIAAKLAPANIGACPLSIIEAFDDLFSKLSRSIRSGMTYLSSDAVFSGVRGGYFETDAPDAAEPYGMMHVFAEQSLSKHVPNHLIVRPSFLFDVDYFHKDRRLSQLHGALTSRTNFFGDTNVYKSPVRVAEGARIVVERTLERQTGIVHVPARRQSVYQFFQESLAPLNLTRFRQYLVLRTSDKPSDTSLRSMFE